MATLQSRPDSGLTRNANYSLSRTAAVTAGVSFLALFLGWGILYGWLTTTFPGDNNVMPGLLSAVFWLIVFGVVVAAARWTRVVFVGWTTRDILLVAVVGAAFGPLFAQWTNVYKAAGSFLGPWNDLIGGFWWLPAILIPYIVRKPGAALVGETLAAIISVIGGSPYGIIGTAVAGLVEGMGAEVIFMLFGWKRFDWLTLTLAGVASAITGFIYLWPIYYANYDLGLVLTTAAAYVIGVVVIAVIGGKLLGNALLATGVLDRFQIGRDRRAQMPSEDF